MGRVFKPRRHAPLPTPAHHTAAQSPAGTLPQGNAKFHLGNMYGPSRIKGMQQEHDNQPKEHGEAPPEALHTRLCVGSLVGLIWSVCFVAVAIPAWLIMVPAGPNATVSLGQRIFQAFAFLSFAGLLGGPLVSASSIARIRKSAGQLTGLRMATVGLWLPPLTIVAAVIFMLLASSIASLTEDRVLSSNLQLIAAAVVLISTVAVLWKIVRHADRAQPH